MSDIEVDCIAGLQVCLIAPTYRCGVVNDQFKCNCYTGFCGCVLESTMVSSNVAIFEHSMTVLRIDSIGRSLSTRIVLLTQEHRARQV